ncbi:MAG: hypothetical protein H7Z12_15540 [Rhodospirillaceae bacterium]|nr:hypothetical protein [Rhodospirillales bacterium]
MDKTEDFLARHYNKVLILSIIAMSIMAFFTFSGAKGHYFFPIEYIFGASIPGQDIYINNSYIFDTSLFFKIIKALHIDLNNDTVAIPWHIALSAIGTFFLWRMIRVGMPELEASGHIVLTLLLAQGAFKFLAVYTSPISLHNTNPSELSNALSFVALSFLISGRVGTVWVASAFMALMLLTAARGEFLLVPIAALFFVLDGRGRGWKLASLVLPAAAVIYLATLIDHPKDPASVAAIITTVFEREGRQVALHMHGLIPNLLLAASLGLHFVLLRRLPNTPWRRFATATAVVSASAYLFGLWYTWVGYLWIPNHTLILLSFPRAMKFHIFALMATAYALLLRPAAGTPWRHGIFMVAIQALRPTPLGAGLSLGLAAMAVVLPTRWIPGKWRIMPWPPAITALALCLAVLATQVPRSMPMSNAAFSSFGEFKRWSRAGALSPAEWDGFRLLAADPDTYLLIPLVDGKAGPTLAPDDIYPLAGKWPFTNEVGHIYFRPDLRPENLLRQDALERVIAAIRNGVPLDPETRGILAQRHVGVVVPAAHAALFGDVTRHLGPFVLIRF